MQVAIILILNLEPISNTRGYKRPICGFEKILNYAEIAIDKRKFVNESAND